MRMIRFSHRDYDKFQRIHKVPPFTARLLQVFLLQSEDISESFREYDTRYHKEGGDAYNYPLHGRLQIVLLFEADNGLLFTTMRAANPSKLEYYRNAQGEEFTIFYKGIP